MLSHYLGKFNTTTLSKPGTQQCATSRAGNASQRSFYQIFGQQTALRLITESGASSNSECTSRRCTTVTNWNSVCSKCGLMSIRASLTMQLTSGASLCILACERQTLWAYAVENNMPISSQLYDNINVSFLSNTRRFLIFCCKLQQIF